MCGGVCKRQTEKHIDIDILGDTRERWIRHTHIQKDTNTESDKETESAKILRES